MVYGDHMSNERGRVPPPKEEEPEPYTLAAFYRDEVESEQVFDQVQETIFADETANVSGFRMAEPLRRIWHVAVVGEQPAPALDQHLRQLLATGETEELPPEMLAMLLVRRETMRRLGSKVERHYGQRKGRRLK
jgi:hypothetical protein